MSFYYYKVNIKNLIFKIKSSLRLETLKNESKTIKMTVTLQKNFGKHKIQNTMTKNELIEKLKTQIKDSSVNCCYRTNRNTHKH